MSTEKTAAAKKRTLSDWKKRKRHPVTLPSGFEVEVEIPNLPLMVKQGTIPNDLLDAALGAIERQQVTPELIKEQADFFGLLVSVMVKDPEGITPDVINNDELPFEDIELLVELGTRQRDVDAVGNHLGGLHTSKEWRIFRGIEDRD
jgi:hypothetical protein